VEGVRSVVVGWVESSRPTGTARGSVGLEDRSGVGGSRRPLWGRWVSKTALGSVGLEDRSGVGGSRRPLWGRWVSKTRPTLRISDQTPSTRSGIRMILAKRTSSIMVDEACARWEAGIDG